VKNKGTKRPGKESNRSIGMKQGDRAESICQGKGGISASERHVLDPGAFRAKFTKRDHRSRSKLGGDEAEGEGNR